MNSRRPMNSDKFTAPGEADRYLSDCVDFDAAEFEDHPVDGSAATDALDVRRLADMHWLHVLLEFIHDPQPDATDARVHRVMAAIDEPAAATVRPAGSAAPSVPSWVATILSTAAAIGFFAFLWNSSAVTPVSAHAAVRAVYRDAATPVDRQYTISTVAQLDHPSPPLDLEGMLYVRGGDKFVMRHNGFQGDFWCGHDGERNWFLTPTDEVIIEGAADKVLYWAREEGVALPDLKLTTLLDQLGSRYELRFLPDESLDGFPGVLWQRVRGIRHVDDTAPPQMIELWMHPETGVAQRLVLSWQENESEIGLAQVTLDLVGEEPIDEAWYSYRPHSHSRPRAAGVK